jgi:hypothetical protein
MRAPGRVVSACRTRVHAALRRWAHRRARGERGWEKWTATGFSETACRQSGSSGKQPPTRPARRPRVRPCSRPPGADCTHDAPDMGTRASRATGATENAGVGLSFPTSTPGDRVAAAVQKLHERLRCFESCRSACPGCYSRLIVTIFPSSLIGPNKWPAGFSTYRPRPSRQRAPCRAIPTPFSPPPATWPRPGRSAAPAPGG